MKNITLASKTFVGRRSNNQDNCTAVPIKEGVYFLAVADGMGGSVGGQIASKLVLDTALKIITEEAEHDLSPKEMKNTLERVFLVSQKVLAERIKQESSLTGMGTTLTCVLIKDDKYVWGNIGDSRTYLLRNDNLQQITVDHTYVQDFINESGKALPANVLKQYGNYLQKALDGGTDQADIFPKDKEYEMLNEGDIFFLCSDGLITDKVQSDTSLFRDYILASNNLQDAAEQLIALAFHSGSKDNISAVLTSYGSYKRKKIKHQRFKYPPVEKVVKEKKRIRLPMLSTFIGAIAFMLTVLLAYIIFWEPNLSEFINKINPFESTENVVSIREEQGNVAKSKTSELVEPQNINELITKPPVVKDAAFSKDKISKPKNELKTNQPVTKSETKTEEKVINDIKDQLKDEEVKPKTDYAGKDSIIIPTEKKDQVKINNTKEKEIIKKDTGENINQIDLLISQAEDLEKEGKFENAKTKYQYALRIAPLNRKQELTQKIISISDKLKAK